MGSDRLEGRARLMQALVSRRLVFGLALVTLGLAVAVAIATSTATADTTTTEATEATVTTTTTVVETETETEPEESTTPAETSGTTTVSPQGAALVGAAAAEKSNDSETQWGWIAFGILAAAVVIFGIVWLVRSRHRQTPQGA
jgi:cobalamin biosynthesis Mg chelatase CobN